MNKIYYTRQGTMEQRLSKSRSTYRHYYNNHHHEAIYWQLQIQQIFESMAKVIRKGI